MPGRTVTEIKITSKADGEGFRRVAVEWLDEAGAPQSKLYCGYSAVKIFNDLESSTARGEDFRECFLLGLVRGLSVEARP